MKTQTRSRKISLPAAPDFCWPVQIRVRAMMTLSAPRISPDLPASLDVLAEVPADLRQGEAIEAAAHPPDPGAPDWRLSGGQDERTDE
jgi:hypothetical protein